MGSVLDYHSIKHSDYRLFVFYLEVLQLLEPFSQAGIMKITSIIAVTHQ